MSEFQPPPGVNDLISRHLVTPAEIARRAGVSRSAVANWLTRHPELGCLAIPLSTREEKPHCVLWWPLVEARMAELGLPRLRRGRPCKPAETGVAS